MNTSRYMDKQIMDLSKSQPNDNYSGSDFIDFVNPQEGDDGNKEEIVPSYDFQPIRPLGSERPPSQSIESGNGGGARVWNSADSIGVRNYSSLDSTEPAKGVPEKDQNASNAALVSEIDRTMKKYADNLMHALEGVSARISQLESRSRNLENSVDDLKVDMGNNQGSTDGKLRQLENILREVQSGVQVIRDKQDILEGQLHLAKLQVSTVEHKQEPQGHVQPDSFQQTASAPLQSQHQQQPPPSMAQPPVSVSPPHAPAPAPQQSLAPPILLPNQYPPNQIHPPPPRDPYYTPASLPQETAIQHYPPPPQPSQPPLSAPPQYPPAPPQYSQPPLPQQHLPISSMNPPQPQLPLGPHPEDSPYPPPQSYPPSLRQSGHPPNPGNPSSQQFYGSRSHMYEPPSSRPGLGYSPTFGPSSGSIEPPPYSYGGPPPQYGGGDMKQQFSSSQGSGSGYPQLPTARVLPQALPTASAVGGGSGGSSGTGNRVPIDDVVDKVTNMGFSREQVRATVRKLTENGQSVDLNIVLDKLMNDGVEAQPAQPGRGWFGR